ncbi:glycosyltransferase [Pararhizobium mangrovi]|uniref:Rhamnosyl transferase n=1 Tax=Pararhizobium mangrovi TaxID=2590452 RepID=A0A506U658_9HYPH|nr:glycosyltransferase [Pararhizobium mangrovi]TPW29843.1 hypothetical protein FJU11_06825 [Pararhizobium mangrovi]
MRIMSDGYVGKAADAGEIRADQLFCLLTRFNMPITGFRAPQSNVEKAAWETARIPIFRKLTLQSIIRQTRRPDLWLIGFDANRKKEMAPLIEELSAFSWIVPVWSDQAEEGDLGYSSCFAKRICDYLSYDFNHVVTCRVDNDDALHTDYIHSIGRYTTQLENVSDEWLSFPFGAQYAEGEAHVHIYPSSPFLSRIESRKVYEHSFRGRTALFGNHNKVFGRGRVHQIFTEDPMWLMNMHGGNAINALNRSLPALTVDHKFLYYFGMHN